MNDMQHSNIANVERKAQENLIEDEESQPPLSGTEVAKWISGWRLTAIAAGSVNSFVLVLAIN